MLLWTSYSNTEAFPFCRGQSIECPFFSKKRRVLFAVFDLGLEILGHVALYIAILAFLAACYVLFAAYSTEFLCVGVFEDNAVATVTTMHTYNEAWNASDTEEFNKTFAACSTHKSVYNSFIQDRWLFEKNFGDTLPHLDLDPIREKFNEINVSYLTPIYEKYNNFVQVSYTYSSIKARLCLGEARHLSQILPASLHLSLTDKQNLIQDVLDVLFCKFEFCFSAHYLFTVAHLPSPAPLSGTLSTVNGWADSPH
ncbi:hypothetical protein COOONC_20912 [Cooperia oncophora]